MANRFDFVLKPIQGIAKGFKEVVEEFVASRPIIQEIARSEAQKESLITGALRGVGRTFAESPVAFLRPLSSKELGMLASATNSEEREKIREEIFRARLQVITGFATVDAGGAQVADDALGRLKDAIKVAKPLRGKISSLQSAERAERVGRGGAILGEVAGEKGFIQAKAQLAGELLEKRPTFEGLRGVLSQGDIDELFIQIQKHPNLSFFEKITAADGFSELLHGSVPPPSKLKLLENIFGKDLASEVMKKRPVIDKLKDLATEVVNIPRSLLASFDMSAPFRQGILFTVTRPKTAARAGFQMFRQAFSEKNYIQWLDDIKLDPSYRIMQDSGLYIADPRQVSLGLGAKEERFMSNLAEKIPILGRGVRAAERAYTSYLNKMRVDVFQGISAKFRKTGFTPENDPELFRSLAGFINNATGRGDLGKLNRNAQILNTLFFSPRLIASRFNLLNPVWYARQPKPVRMEAIKSFAEFVGVGSTVLTLAKLAGADVEFDPRSTDFGKIRIGNTRWDIWGGFQQWVRVFSQMIAGARKTQKGDIVELTRKKFPFETRYDVAERFFRGKLAPIPSLALELFEGSKLYGDELSFSQEFAENITPLYLQDIKEAFQQLGPWSMITVGAPAFFGVGVQTFEEKRPANRFNF